MGIPQEHGTEKKRHLYLNDELHSGDKTATAKTQTFYVIQCILIFKQKPVTFLPVVAEKQA